MKKNDSELEPTVWDVLLAEDDRILNLVLAMQLESCKRFRVRKAMNGNDTIAMIKQAPPHLLILDISMPGLNGFEIINLLRNDDKLKRTPCIIHTSFDLTDAERADLKLGETRYLMKTASEELVMLALDLLTTSQHATP